MSTAFPVMLRTSFAICLTLLAPILSARAASADAVAGTSNLLVMGEDADPESLPRDSSVFRRVQDTIASELHEAGYDVYDETAVTLGEVAVGRVGRNDAELIEAARDARRPPIDIVAIFTVYAAAQDAAYVTRLRARVTGRLLHVQSGQRLGSFEVSTQKGWRISPDCAQVRSCLLDEVGERTRLIGRDVAVALIAKLDHLADGPAQPPRQDTLAVAAAGRDCLPTAYALTFDGFSEDEILDFEEYLTAFTGYREHRPVAASARHHEYWYRSCSSAARLKRNLTRMLDHLRLEGLVRQSGNDFELHKLTIRK